MTNVIEERNRRNVPVEISRSSFCILMAVETKVYDTDVKALLYTGDFPNIISQEFCVQFILVPRPIDIELKVLMEDPEKF